VIELRSIKKSLGGNEVLKGVSFTLPSNSISGLLGPNGAGKSTTLKCVAGLLAPDSGEILFNGSSSRNQAAIGYLPESPPLYAELKVREQLEVAAGLYGYFGRVQRERIERVVELCKLNPVAEKLIAHLSKGYQQRLGIAQAIIHSPEFLILDEPTSGLDPLQLTEIRALIRELSKEATVVFSSHILQEVSELCSKVVLILNGAVTWEGERSAAKELEARFVQGVVG
jgi:ABC-2 type transport system ATP-binding protein